MGQTADQIELHISQTREDLGSNLDELEWKVKSVTNWNRYFQRNPTAMLSVAFGVGILAARWLRGGKKRRAPQHLAR
jgi:hypothetical protein